MDVTNSWEQVVGSPESFTRFTAVDNKHTSRGGEVRATSCATMDALEALRKALPDYGDDDTLEYMASVVADSDGDDLEENLAE